MPKSIKKLNRSATFLSGLFLSILLGLSGRQAFALTLAPTRLDISGDPGQILSGKLEIYNEQDREITFYVSAQNFEARGETGSPFFLPETDKGLASWINTAESIVVGPKERVEFPYEITIPQDTSGGGYFAAIFFATSPATPEESGQVTIGSKVGTLVFLNVSGDAPEGAGIIEFGAKDGKLFSYLPITLYYRFSNDGARKVMPLGAIEINNMFGNKAAVLDANASQGNVLPGSVRRFEIVWSELNEDSVSSKDKDTNKNTPVVKEGEKIGFFQAVKIQKENFAIGKYTANLDLDYSNGDKKTASSQTSFWVIPWQLLTLVIGALIIAIVIISLITKRHNKKLIERVKKETLIAQSVTIAPTETVKEENPEPINPAQ